MRRRQLGQRGEQLAADYLQQQGYRLTERNYRCRLGEIDLIAWDAQTLVFIEVKTKGHLQFGVPQSMVTRSKQQKIVRVAMVYVQERHLRDKPLRFDVIAITSLAGITPEIVHIPAAFSATEFFSY